MPPEQLRIGAETRPAHSLEQKLGGTSINLINPVCHLVGNLMMIADHTTIVVSRAMLIGRTIGRGVNLQTKIRPGASSGRMYAENPHPNTTILRRVLDCKRPECHDDFGQVVRLAPVRAKSIRVLLREANAISPERIPSSSRLNKLDNLLSLGTPLYRYWRPPCREICKAIGDKDHQEQDDEADAREPTLWCGTVNAYAAATNALRQARRAPRPG